MTIGLSQEALAWPMVTLPSNSGTTCFANFGHTAGCVTIDGENQTTTTSRINNTQIHRHRRLFRELPDFSVYVIKDIVKPYWGELVKVIASKPKRGNPNMIEIQPIDETNEEADGDEQVSS